MLRMSGWGEGLLVFNATPAVTAGLGFYTVRAVIARGFSNDYDVMGMAMHYRNLSDSIRFWWWSQPPRDTASGRMQVYQTGDPSYGSTARGISGSHTHGAFWTLTATTARSASGAVVLYIQLQDACGANMFDNSDNALIGGSVWAITLRSTAPTTGAFGLYGRVNEGALLLLVISTVSPSLFLVCFFSL
jgi:hypothetical protein